MKFLLHILLTGLVAGSRAPDEERTIRSCEPPPRRTTESDERAIREAEEKRRRRQLRPQGSGMLSANPTDPQTGRSTDPEMIRAVAERSSS